jgi:hypothetical protein
VCSVPSAAGIASSGGTSTVVIVQVDLDDINVFLLIIARASFHYRSFHPLFVFLIISFFLLLNFDPPRALLLPTASFLVLHLPRSRLLLFFLLLPEAKRLISFLVPLPSSFLSWLGLVFYESAHLLPLRTRLCVLARRRTHRGICDIDVKFLFSLLFFLPGSLAQSSCF